MTTGFSPPMLDRVRWLLGYALVVETTFQFLLQAWSQTVEVFLFVTIVGGFVLVTLVAKGFKGLVGIVADTWTQRLAALFVAALSITFLWGDQSPRSVLALLRLPTCLIVVALVAETVREEGRMTRFAWGMLSAIGLLYALALVELVFGSGVLGLQCSKVEECWMRSHPRNWHWPGLLENNRTAVDADALPWQPPPRALLENLRATVIGTAYGMNRLLLFAVLAYAAGIGIALTAERRRAKALAAGLVAFVFCGLILIESRSTLVVIVAFVAFVVLAWRDRRVRRFVKPGILASLTAFAAAMAFWQMMPGDSTSIDRIERTALIYRQGLEIESDQTRLANWTLALDMFLNSPIGGAGFRSFPHEARKRLFGNRPAPSDIGGGAPLVDQAARGRMGYQNVGVHNGYLEVLAEAGLLGALPFLALLATAAAWTLTATSPLSESAAAWRVVFAVALVGILTINLVDTHTEDRYFWILLGLVAALENWRRAARSGKSGNG